MNEQFHWIDLVKLHDHPQNPRLIRRDDVINAIAAGINGSFDPAHALIRNISNLIRQSLLVFEAGAEGGAVLIPNWDRDPPSGETEISE